MIEEIVPVACRIVAAERYRAGRTVSWDEVFRTGLQLRQIRHIYQRT